MEVPTHIQEAVNSMSRTMAVHSGFIKSVEKLSCQNEFLESFVAQFNKQHEATIAAIQQFAMPKETISFIQEGIALKKVWIDSISHRMVPDISELKAFASGAVSSLAFYGSSLKDYREYSQSLMHEFIGFHKNSMKSFTDFVLTSQSLLESIIKDDSTQVCATELPLQGWHFSGEEPYSLSVRIAKKIKSKEWNVVNTIMMAISKHHLESKNYESILGTHNIPHYTRKRFQLFLDHYKNGQYEEAVSIGIPLIDAVAEHLYSASFTTKRHKHSINKPEIAIQRSSGCPMGDYHLKFLQRYGSLQLNINPARLADDDYWNRSAIVHGKMKRCFNEMDTAKCYMCIMFLSNAKKDA